MHKTYFTWSFHVLLGADPVRTDEYLNVNLDSIKRSAACLLRQIDYTPAIIYRGVVLRAPKTILEPHKNFTYLSFSTDRNIATHFGNPTGFPSLFKLGDYGYIMEYAPQAEEILYHYRFFDLLPYEQAFLKIGFTASGQKEVTILQPAMPFQLAAYTTNTHYDFAKVRTQLKMDEVN